MSRCGAFSSAEVAFPACGVMATMLSAGDGWPALAAPGSPPHSPLCRGHRLYTLSGSVQERLGM